MKKLFFPIAAVVVLTSMSFTSVNTNSKNETKLGTLEKVSLKDFKSTSLITGTIVISYMTRETNVIFNVWIYGANNSSEAKMNSVITSY